MSAPISGANLSFRATITSTGIRGTFCARRLCLRSDRGANPELPKQGPCMNAPLISRLRAGVIGTGFIGPVHIEALRRLGVRVTALCDLPDRVDAAAAKYGIPLAFGDFRQLLNSPEVDVVHITVPNRFHCTMALAALEAGKHCIC